MRPRRRLGDGAVLKRGDGGGGKEGRKEGNMYDISIYTKVICSALLCTLDHRRITTVRYLPCRAVPNRTPMMVAMVTGDW